MIWKRKLLQIRHLTVKDIVLCIYYRFFLYILRLYFGFDKWHSGSPFYCKPYKKQLVDLINQLKISSALEIGCGLGDIISRINAPLKYAYDNCLKTIQAAKFLYPNSGVTFLKGTFNNIKKHKSEAVILIGWLHEMEPKILSSNILKIIKLTNCRYLVVDGVRREVKNYGFYLSANFWKQFGTIEKIITSIDQVRYFYLIKVIK